MLVTDKTALSWNKKVEFEKVTTIYLENRNISRILFKTIQWKNLSFLSLRNNSINRVGFIKSMNNIWYLDLRNNNVNNLI